MDEGTRRGRGRPRSERAREAVLDVALRLLLAGDNGESITMDAVARESKVPKSTMYRHWSSKTALLLDALSLLAEREIPVQWEGPVEESMRRFFSATFSVTADTGAGKALCRLAAEAGSDAEAARLLGDLISRRRNVARGIIERGIASGELREDIDVDIILDTLYGPFWYRLLFGHAPLDEDFARQLIDQLLRGAAKHPKV